MKYPRTPHLLTSPGATKDDKRMPNWGQLVGREIVITEKLDGSNTTLHDGKVFSRGGLTTHPTFDFIKSVYGSRTLGNKNQVFYGENLYGIHSIVYDRLPVYFYVFAVYDYRYNFLDWDSTKDVAMEYGFSMVPELWRGTVKYPSELQLIIRKLIDSGSAYGDTIEGVVVRVTDSFGYSGGAFHNCVGKWVRANHVQTDQHWTRNWKKADLL